MKRPALILRGTVFDPPLFCAPMAGITHSAFRRLLADFGGYGALYTEMLSARMIPHDNLRDSPWVKRRPQEGKVVYQLLAVDTVRLAESVDRLAGLAPDALDLNAACSAPAVRRQRGGSELFDDAARLGDVVRCMRRCWSGPLFVKIRLGRPVPEWRGTMRNRLRLLEDEGVDAVVIHARFSGESLSRPARVSLYPELAGETRLPIVANGDITGPDICKKRAALLEPVSGLMVGRMAAARPWVFGHWQNAPAAVSPAEIWRRMLGYLIEDFPEVQALMRVKILTPYFARNFIFGHTLFKAVQGASDLDTARKRADDFLSASPLLSTHISLDGI